MASLAKAFETVTISVAEFERLKDIETRFKIIKGQMLHAEYCPIHTQIILGIERECEAKKQELKLDLVFNDNCKKEE